MTETEKSRALSEKANRIIVGGGQGHKRPSVYEPCPYPSFIERGKGSRIWDVDGNEYIDYLLSFGPIVLGHCYPRVNEAVQKQMDEGAIFNLHHPLETELAEKLIELIPCAEMVAFFATGSEATSGAVKLARGFTGKEKMIRCGYHGWHDWCTAGQRGVPAVLGRYTIPMEYNNLESLKDILEANKGEVACVIMEPIVGGPPNDGYLEGVRDLTHEHEGILIFDEVKTGFRFALGGAQQLFGVTPDLATFSKAMANGYPIAAVVGSKKILDEVGDVWTAATFNGQLCSVAAALATIKELEDRDGIAHLWEQGKRLMKGLDDICASSGVDARPSGMPPMPRLEFGTSGSEGVEEIKNAFYTETIKRGVFFHPGHPWFLSLSHNDGDIDRALEVSEEAMKLAKR